MEQQAHQNGSQQIPANPQSSSSNLAVDTSPSLNPQTSSSSESSEREPGPRRFVRLRNYFIPHITRRRRRRDHDPPQSGGDLLHDLHLVPLGSPPLQPWSTSSASGSATVSHAASDGSASEAPPDIPGALLEAARARESRPRAFWRRLRRVSPVLTPWSSSEASDGPPEPGPAPPSPSTPGPSTSGPSTPATGFDISDLYNVGVDQETIIDPRIVPLIVVVGVGYVGEQLVNIFSQKFEVIGFEISTERARVLSEIYAGNPNVKITTQPSAMRRATHFLISVPTLLRPDKAVDTSSLTTALSCVALNATPGSTVVIESSVAVGMTRRLLGPIASQYGLYAGMSPERVDPGRSEPPAHEIPKIISGLDDLAPGSLRSIEIVYSQVFDSLVKVTKPEVAEMTKLYENCQRMVCIAFANEMANACETHRIDPFEVCRAAATKPFGYMPMMPSLGVGGHCIPINPHYLLSTNRFPILKAATEKMEDRPYRVARRALRRVNEFLCALPVQTQQESEEDRSDDAYASSATAEIAFGDADADLDDDSDDFLRLTPTRYHSSRPRILVVGIGFKAGQSHLANSPGLKLTQILFDGRRCRVQWCDPLVPQSSFTQVRRYSEADWTAEKLTRNFDMIIVAFHQHGLDFSVLDEVENVLVEKWCP